MDCGSACTECSDCACTCCASGGGSGGSGSCPRNYDVRVERGSAGAQGDKGPTGPAGSLTYDYVEFAGLISYAQSNYVLFGADYILGPVADTCPAWCALSRAPGTFTLLPGYYEVRVSYTSPSVAVAAMRLQLTSNMSASSSTSINTWIQPLTLVSILNFSPAQNTYSMTTPICIDVITPFVVQATYGTATSNETINVIIVRLTANT